MPSPIALLTDFGLEDPYVGQMKGALLRHAPAATLVDLSHQVLPFNILQAGFFLSASQVHFPAGTIFVAIVDPGVGSGRRILLAEVDGRFFLAPDNGLLTQLLMHVHDPVVRDVTPAGAAGASATFHGRDVFAPLAARLFNGDGPATLGKRLDPHELVQLDGVRPVFAGISVSAVVLHVDRFGNCLLNLDTDGWALRLAACQEVRLAPSTTGHTNICLKRVPPARPVSPAESLDILGSEASSLHVALRCVTTYAELGPGEAGLIAGSQGYMELAMNQASAANSLGLVLGGPVTISVAGPA